MPTRASAPAFTALALLLLAGCGAPAPGDASPAPDHGDLTGSAPAASLPPRPAELSLRDVDPCTLLTTAQLDELKVNSKPRPVADRREGPSCSLDVDLTEPYYSYGIEPLVDADLTAWLTGERRNNSMTTEPATVEGFPALRNYRGAGVPADCESLVGVAPGQTLRVQMYPVTDGVFGQRQLCDMAEQAATLAVRSLKARS